MFTCLLLLLVGCLASPDVGAHWTSPPTPTEPRTPPVAAASPAPTTLGSGLVYEVYVRSYQDNDGDGIGDLAGLVTRLDYIASLGVTTLWLLPITPSATPDGNAVLDHSTVAPEYGEPESLRRLVIEAHARGLRVLLETPLNAVSRNHPAFVEALADEDSEARDLFRFDAHPPKAPGWVPIDGEAYYAWGGPDLPDLNWDNPDVGEMVLGAQRGWIDQGVDGFVYRDVAPLIEPSVEPSIQPPTPSTNRPSASRRAMATIADTIHAHDDEARLYVGPDDPSVAGTTAWLGASAPPIADFVLDTPRQGALHDALLTADRASLLDVYAAQGPDPARMCAFLGSDRAPRLTTTLTDPDARRVAMVVHLLSAGQPVLYYGEELDLLDADAETLPDAPWRGLMRWDTTQGAGFSTAEPWFPLDPGPGDPHNVAEALADERSMLRLVKALGDLRTQSVAARTGVFTVLATDDARALAFERSTNDERVVVIVNLTPDELPDLRVAVAGPLNDLTSPGATHEEGDHLAFGPVAPYAYTVLEDRVPRPHPIPVVR